MPTKLPVDQYLTADIFKELGMENVSPEDRVSFLESFGNVIQQRLTLRVMQELSDEQKTNLETLLFSRPSDDASLGNFLLREIPGFQSIAEEEIASYKKELIDRFQALQTQ